MGLFQSTVIEKYINAQNQKVLKEKWEVYKVHFHDPNIQENIRNAKEEQYQEGFLRDLFVKILGYTLNPAKDYNLTTELKNVKDSKKADGGIIVNDKVKGVIELKGTNTTDLSKIETQAFGYKNNQSGCTYVITSNFEKLRFYIDNAIEYQAFNLFELNETEFSLLYLCLAYDNISRDLPKKIKNDSHNQEEITTKQLYKDYSLFKRELFNNLVELNTTHEPLLLFKKSQKLLDRFLFLFFAEDRHLLPPNSVRLILKQWKQLREMDAYTPLYKRFKKYFGYLNTGHKGKQYDVYPYNGGLFRPDEVLDKITINDDLLYKYTLKLSEYDFASEVDVNILGHIFENSLNEIEEIQTQLEENPNEVKLSKRKKDGVFYTPKYITKYIVENTIGKLCEEKKIEANLVEEDYDLKRQAKTKKTLLEKLNTYREWLLQLTVVDPACGSGAFLNEALNYLIAEHQYLDELETKLMGGGLVFPNVENSILENNLFGVDINSESVEIAKLSLWLRTAQPNRKLNDLSDNIKCGNSLIDNPEVAGDKAFNWEKEFPQVFAKDGFDVVIGNPPYLRVQGLRENLLSESLHLEKKYLAATGRFDIYVLFIELSYKLINVKGLTSFILPHKFLIASFGNGIRKFLKEKRYAESLVHFGSEIIFSEASTYTCILNLRDDSPEVKYKYLNSANLFQDFKWNSISYSFLDIKSWNLNSQIISNIFSKKGFGSLSTICDNISRGVVTGYDGVFILEGAIKGRFFNGHSKAMGQDVVLESELIKPLLKGNSLERYSETINEVFLLYPHKTIKGKTQPIKSEMLQKDFPLIFQYLSHFKKELYAKKIKYKTNEEFWYGLHNSRDESIFENVKIITPYLSLYSQMILDTERDYYTNDKCSCIILKPKLQPHYKELLAILNSKLTWFYIQNVSSEYSGGYFAYTSTYLNPLPIPPFNDYSRGLNEMVENIIKIKMEFDSLLSKFYDLIIKDLNRDNSVNKKLQNWHELSFSNFIKGLNKAIKATNKRRAKEAVIILDENEERHETSPYEVIPALTKKDEFEWIELFEENKKKAVLLKTQIHTTNKEIDQMVYELYGLTKEEIEIVENS